MEAAANNINVIPFIPAAATAVRSIIPAYKHNFPVDGLWNTTKIFSSIWESSNEGMRFTDHKGYIVAVNPTFCRRSRLIPENVLNTRGPEINVARFPVNACAKALNSPLLLELLMKRRFFSADQ